MAMHSLSSTQFERRPRWQKLQARWDERPSCDRAGNPAEQLDGVRKEAARSQALARDVHMLSH